MGGGGRGREGGRGRILDAGELIEEGVGPLKVGEPCG